MFAPLKFGKLALNVVAAKRFSRSSYLRNSIRKKDTLEEYLTISELYPKKKGCPGTRQVQKYIPKLCDDGSSVDTMVVISPARGLAKVIEPTQLSGHIGPATLNAP